MSDETIYEPSGATMVDGRPMLTCGDEAAWLYENGAPAGSSWHSPGEVPGGGRIWIRSDGGRFVVTEKEEEKARG